MRAAPGFDGRRLSLGLAAPLPLRCDGAGVVADFTLREGEKATFVLRRLGSRGQSGRCPGGGEAEELFRDTVAFWAALALQVYLHPAAGEKWSTARP